MKIYPDLKTVVREMILFVLDRGYKLQPDNWQGTKVADNPQARMIENLNFSFQVMLPNEDLDYYRAQLSPSMPWSDNHFLERVSGKPLNPPPSASWWPYAKEDNKDYKADGKVYDHSYPERLWPKHTGPNGSIMRGIRYNYGDLNDVIDLLQRDRQTRQAFIPIFFPEDTGSVGNMRIPCTVGFHVIQRANYFHMAYWIRSIDILRHARNDLYMAIRLLLWLLDQLRSRDPHWKRVKPGIFSFHSVSTHCFVGDELLLRKQLKDLL